MKLRSLFAALAVIGAAPALAQQTTPEPPTPSEKRTPPGVPAVVRIDPARVVNEDTYAKQPVAFPRWNDPIQVRQSFSPELQRSAQNLD